MNAPQEAQQALVEALHPQAEAMAIGEEPFGDGPADAPRRAGDQRPFATESEIHTHLHRPRYRGRWSNARVFGSVNSGTLPLTVGFFGLTIVAH